MTKDRYIQFRCPQCGEHAHDIVSWVKPDTYLRGDHFKKTQKMVDLNWTCFPEFDNIVGANIVCPYCDQQYSITGHVHPESMPDEWRTEYGV